MSFLSKLWNICVNFLFPKNERVLELESIPTEELHRTLPQAEALPDINSLAIFDYNHPLVKELVWEVKYNGNIKIAEKLAEILYDVLRQDLEEQTLFGSINWHAERPIIVPIPISDKRRFERGWNQSELLVRQMMKHDTPKTFKYLPRQLAKLRHTESQTKTSSRKERLKNLTDSMRVLNPETIKGRCVVVIDDVTTTGSTFTEARRALYDVGAKKIFCVAIAH